MTNLTPKEITNKAMNYLIEMLNVPKNDISLEEISFLPEKHEWSTTFGYFEKITDQPENRLLPTYLKKYSKRYKIVTVDEFGNFKSIKKHEID